MQTDPAHEWQRLTRLYGEMSDEQLENLGATFGDLTEFAQPILRDEMRKRGLGDPTTNSVQQTEKPGWWSADSESADDEDSENGPTEYTWKTDLCARDTWEEAWQIAEMLRRAGIQSWPDKRGTSFGTRSNTSQPVRVLVAADQLDEARQILLQPIPQDIIDQSKVKVEDFVPPTCPKCGAEDPLLESVEPTNRWRCENCGARWSDAMAVDPATSAGY